MEQLGKCLSQPKQNLVGVSSHLPPWKQHPLLSQEPAEIWASQLAQAKKKSCTFRMSKDPARVRFRQSKPLIDLHSKGSVKPSNPNPIEDRIRNVTDTVYFTLFWRQNLDCFIQQDFLDLTRKTWHLSAWNFTLSWFMVLFETKRKLLLRSTSTQKWISILTNKMSPDKNGCSKDGKIFKRL